MVNIIFDIILNMNSNRNRNTYRFLFHDNICMGNNSCLQIQIRLLGYRLQIKELNLSDVLLENKINSFRF